MGEGEWVTRGEKAKRRKSEKAEKRDSRIVAAVHDGAACLTREAQVRRPLRSTFYALRALAGV